MKMERDHNVIRLRTRKRCYWFGFRRWNQILYLRRGSGWASLQTPLFGAGFYSR
jgi:hypothetical protein